MAVTRHPFSSYALMTCRPVSPKLRLTRRRVPDRRSLGYGVYWNAMKKLAAAYPAAAQQAMFYGNAARIYRLTTSA